MKSLINHLHQFILVSTLILLSACTVVPKKLDSLGQDNGVEFTRKAASMSATMYFTDTVKVNALPLTYVGGDILRIRIVGLDQANDLYQLTKEGRLDLPFAPALPATGLTRAQLIESIEYKLVELKWFYQGTVKVDLSAVRLAPVSVSVVGAVFNPGRVTINQQPVAKPESAIEHAAGTFSNRRDLVSAIVAAGGIRPDAEVSEVYLKRGNQLVSINLVPMIDGIGFTESPLLINGDQVIIPSSGAVNRVLIKPTQVTPPGMRVFMSNLTAPSLSNAQSAVGVDATRLPYGSSLLDAAISANCVGGTDQANASRSLILVTRNFGSNQQMIVRRSINQMLASSSNQSVNPFLMPNDGVACYDSRFTNFRDVARGIGEVISPILLGKIL